MTGYMKSLNIPACRSVCQPDLRLMKNNNGTDYSFYPHLPVKFIDALRSMG